MPNGGGVAEESGRGWRLAGSIPLSPGRTPLSPRAKTNDNGHIANAEADAEARRKAVSSESASGGQTRGRRGGGRITPTLASASAGETAVSSPASVATRRVRANVGVALKSVRAVGVFDSSIFVRDNGVWNVDIERFMKLLATVFFFQHQSTFKDARESPGELLRDVSGKLDALRAMITTDAATAATAAAEAAAAAADVGCDIRSDARLDMSTEGVSDEAEWAPGDDLSPSNGRLARTGCPFPRVRSGTEG
eukprot:g5938.t1